MTETSPFKCVNCGEPASALYKTYGPTVLKLTKCTNCKGLVDKYVEYDPVIVMIDLVLMSREAQRHVLYNTEFKSFWKLLIILMMLETYGVWKNDSLFIIAVNSLCGLESNNTITNVSIPLQSSIENFGETCLMWTYQVKPDENNLFIWEKDFYVQFISTCIAMLVFLITTNMLMKSASLVLSHIGKVTLMQLVKSFSLAHVSILFTLPMLVWGADMCKETKAIHYLLAFGYSFAVFVNVYTVLYKRPMAVTVPILLISNGLKFVTSFYTIPYLRRLAP